MPSTSMDLGRNPFRMPRRLNPATPPEALLSNKTEPSQREDVELDPSTTAHPSAAGSSRHVSLSGTQTLDGDCKVRPKDASLSQGPSCTAGGDPDVEIPREHILGRQVSRAFILTGFSQKYLLTVYRDGTFFGSVLEGTEEDDGSEGSAFHTLTTTGVSSSVSTEKLARLPWQGRAQQSPRYQSLKEVLAKFSSPVLASDKILRRSSRILRTGLGRLPPEIREEIWKYVFSFHTVTDHDSVHQLGLEDAMSAITLNGTSSPSPRFGNACPAILLVCRSIYEEAHYIYYAHNMFHFTSPSHLRGFLTKIGPGRCEHITTLHLSGFTRHSPVFTEDELDEMCPDGAGTPGRRERLAARTIVGEHPHSHEAGVILQQCRNLKRIFLTLKVDEELVLISFLIWVYGYRETVVEFSDDFHWVVRRSTEEESRRWNEDFWRRAEPQESIWGDDLDGNERLIEVEIASSVFDGRH